MNQHSVGKMPRALTKGEDSYFFPHDCVEAKWSTYNLAKIYTDYVKSGTHYEQEM